MGAETKKDAEQTIQPEHWVDKYADALFRYAYIRTGSRDSAEDLVQETFLAALEGYRDFKGRSSIRTWLISILQHKISEHFRNAYRQPVKSSQIDSESHSFFENGHWKQMPARWSRNPEEETGNKEFRRVLLKCLQRLSSAVADAFILRELEMMEPSEICERLNISDTGLWSRLHRARLNLRHCLEKTWFSEGKV